MKKILAVALAVIMLAVVGCTTNTQTTTVSEINATVETSETSASEKTTIELSGLWSMAGTIISEKEYTLAQMKEIFSDELFKSINISFEFTDKTVSVLNADKQLKAKSNYFPQEGKDNAYITEEKDLTFELKDGRLLVKTDSNILIFKK